MGALDTLLQLHNANPYNPDINKAYLGALTNPALNGTLGEILNGGSQSPLMPQGQSNSLGNHTLAFMNSQNFNPDLLGVREKAALAAQQGSQGQQTSQPQQGVQDGNSYDQSFINNIPIFGGLLNAAGRLGAGASSGISSIAADAGGGINKLINPNAQFNISNPITSAMQGLSNPDQAKQLGSQIEGVTGTQLNPILKGALDIGSGLAFDPSMYMGGAGLLGKAGKIANGAVKGLTGLDALGLAGDLGKAATSKAGSMLGGLGRAAENAAPTVEKFAGMSPKAEQIMNDVGGIADQNIWKTPEQVKQANQSANYGMDFSNKGQHAAQQADAVISNAGDALNETLGGINAPIKYDDLLGSVKNNLAAKGYNKTAQTNVSDIIDNMLMAGNDGSTLATLPAAKAAEIERNLGAMGQKYSTSDPVLSGAIRDTQSHLMDSLHDAVTGKLPQGKIFTPEQTQNIITEAKLDPLTQKSLIDDITNARTIKDVKNIQRNMYYNKDLADNAFKPMGKDVPDEGFQDGLKGVINAPKSALDAGVNKIVNGAGATASKAGGVIGNVAGGVANAVKDNFSGNSILGRAFQGVPGSFAAQHYGAIGDLLDRGIAGQNTSSPQTATTDGNAGMNTGNIDIQKAINNNLAAHNKAYNDALAMGLPNAEAKSIAESKAHLLTTDERKSLGSTSKALNLVDQLSQAYDSLGSMKGFGGGNISAALGGIGADQNVARYNSQLKALTVELAGALGSGGQGKFKIINDEGLLPQITDSPQTKAQKIAQIRQILNSNASDVLGMVGR